jgi:Na+-driven multidrug efflux pump
MIGRCVLRFCTPEESRSNPARITDLTSVALGALGYALAPSLLDLLGVAQDVRAGALGFMRVSFVGIIFVFTYAMFQALMRGIGQTRLPLLIVLGTVILNFALDPLFIFGCPPGAVGSTDRCNTFRATSVASPCL